MTAAELHKREAERVEALRAYGLLDDDADSGLDDLAAIAARIADAPIALVSLLDGERLWVKAQHGIVLSELPYAESFCVHVVAASAPLVVEDATLDPRFVENALVRGEPFVRFYAGFPLEIPGGFAVGTLAVFDRAPRQLDAETLQMLGALARQIVDRFELRRRNLALDRMVRERETYHSFFQLTVDLFATLDDELCFSYCNPAWETTLGWTLTELRVVPFASFVHPDDLDATLDRIARLVRGEVDRVDFAHRFRHKLGAWVHLAWLATFRDGVIYASARDVTALHANRAELTRALELSSEQSSRLHSILSTATCAIIETNAARVCREVNPAAEQMLGASATELIGRKIPFHPAQPSDDAALELSRQLGLRVASDGDAMIFRARRGAADRGEWVYRRRDDAIVVDVSVAARRSPSGDEVGFVWIVNDITERKQIERALVDFKSTLDRTTDSIFIYDPETLRFSYANEGATRHLGYSNRELLQMTPLDLHPSLDAVEYRKRLDAARHSEPPVIAFESTHRHRDGNMVPVEIVLQYLAPAGQPARFIKIARDICERKRVEQAQSEFVATVSHELRTPLTAIRGALGLVAAGVTGELPAEAREYIEIATSNSDRLVRLINDILDIEKMQSSAAAFVLEPLELRSILRQAIDANQPVARAAGAHLVLASEVPAGHVIVDRDRLMQVIANLVSNAAKFSPPGTAIELAVSDRDATARIEIRDHGPGVPAEFRARLFQRFAQANASSTRRNSGTGLGLSISKAIVERMAGQIGYEHAATGGACFFVELPLIRPGAPRVLHVESDADVRRIVKKMLPESWVIDGVDSVRAARRALAESAYDVVIVELSLHDGRSAPVLESVGRADVIIFSANEAPAELAELAALTIVKTRGSPTALRDAVIELVDRRQPRSPS